MEYPGRFCVFVFLSCLRKDGCRDLNIFFFFLPEGFCWLLQETSSGESSDLVNVFYFLFALQSTKALSCPLFLFSLETVVRHMYFHSAYKWETYNLEMFSDSTKVIKATKAEPASKPGLSMPKPVFFLLHHSCHLETGQEFLLYFLCFFLGRNSLENIF